LLGFALHPEFGLTSSTNRGFVYVYYSYSPTPTNNPGLDTVMYNRLSRFTVPDGGLIADPASEMVLINQFDRNFWHNGGGIFFGPDGFLYLSNGDEGGEYEQFNNSQVISNGFFAGIFRIDVDMKPDRSHPIRRQIRDHGGLPAGWPPTFSTNYFVPNDNPWQDPGGSVLEEFYAIGLRNPHRMTYDPPTGRIWVGDVGQETQEEIDVIQKGGNYQWAYFQGTVPGPKTKPDSLIGTDSPPLYTYGRSVGKCVIGGYVYRGAQYAANLTGQYIFGDFVTGRISSLTYDGHSPPVVTDLCGMTEYALSSFGLDQSGEIYLCSYLEGKILKLNLRPDPAPILVVPTRTAPDRMELNFTNFPALSFSMIGTTNLGLSLTDWSALGQVREILPGLYNFTNTSFPTGTARFFRVRQP
jgi:glucose/arabinose dehydrogenase